VTEGKWFHVGRIYPAPEHGREASDLGGLRRSPSSEPVP
jgi:hypothetical protein